MKTVSLSVEARAKDITPKDLRRDDVIPCVVYGNDTENTPIQCSHKALLNAYRQAGASTLVELTVNGKKLPVLFHAIDFHPVTEAIMHVDFYAVDMKKEIEAKVPVQFIGEAPAVKDLGGVLVTTLDHVTVTCLPTNLPQNLTVDISDLKEFGDAITIAALQIPEGVVISEEPTTVLVTIQEPRRAEEEETAEAEEGEEGAEGTEGAEGEEGKEEGGKKEGEAESGDQKAAPKE